MKINVKLTNDDYIAFNQYVTMEAGYGKRAAFFHRLGVPGISAVIFIVMLVGGAPMKTLLGMLILLVAISAFWVRMSPAIFRRNMRRNVERILAYGNPPYHPEAELEFTEDRVIERTPETTNEYFYSDLVLKETQEYWYLLYNDLQGLIIPKAEAGEQVIDLKYYLNLI